MSENNELEKNLWAAADKLRSNMDAADKHFTFTKLVSSIQGVHNELLGQAKRAININLSLRNWLIGCYVAEYEMRGDDRAKYGDQLMDMLAKTLTKLGVSRCDRRELKRQIDSLYYERTGLSRNKKKLTKLANTKAEQTESHLTIRDPYIFEFLGLKAKEVMGESHLEDVLLDKLQDFLLELGHGFCFEARQKRILIGETHNFIDLVFYHRILKCHVLVELKLAGFSHESIGQLNTYVSWYKKNVMADTDNPPIGILLCTRKDHALVEYALAGLDNQLFVSKYQLELPKQKAMQRFLERQIKEVGL